TGTTRLSLAKLETEVTTGYAPGSVVVGGPGGRGASPVNTPPRKRIAINPITKSIIIVGIPPADLLAGARSDVRG
ncbi:MAG TPA: hypothetical protein VK905_00230, partial [Bacillota bacterium]|nr:hypothetical protein [Bacillota bacterium]